MGLALHLRHDTESSFPPGYLFVDTGVTQSNAPGWAWGYFLLPYLDQDNLYRGIDRTTPVELPANLASRTQPLKMFMCPSDPETGVFTVMDATNITSGGRGNQ